MLNLALAFIMFGVALSLETRHFREVARNPKGFWVGVVSQFIFLPAITFLLVYFLRPHPGLALGMILVAACPGGNVSNFYSLVAGGNVALSVSLTGFATFFAVFLTPLNFEFWGSILPETEEILNSIDISFFEMAKTLVLILIIPLLLGIWFRRKFPPLTIRIEKYVRILSFLILAAFIGFALAGNMDVFSKYIHYVVYLVLLHNALALITGYLTAKITRLNSRDVKTITIETGIQNSGLGLLIIFTFFDGMGPMALITAWWGIWHLISGIVSAIIFRRFKISQWVLKR
jgi:BASS family bile acid:Na+ symporter